MAHPKDHSKMGFGRSIAVLTSGGDAQGEWGWADQGRWVPRDCSGEVPVTGADSPREGRQSKERQTAQRLVGKQQVAEPGQLYRSVGTVPMWGQQTMRYYFMSTIPIIPIHAQSLSMNLD